MERKFGTYRYHQMLGGELIAHYLPVEILAEKVTATGFRCYVKFMTYHVDGRPPGSKAWVKLKNVRYKTVAPVVPDIRLPYKD